MLGLPESVVELVVEPVVTPEDGDAFGVEEGPVVEVVVGEAATATAGIER